MNCIIVDDDLMARKSLERLCKKTGFLKLAAVCSGATEGLKILSKDDTIDLVFLDIEMPDLNGLDFMDQLPSTPQIILTTSKKEYAYEAFEYQVTDYLKKPISYPRFIKSVEKAMEVQRQNETYKTIASEVYIKEDGKFVRISYEDILFFENVGDYVRIRTNESSHIIHSTLKNIASKLKDSRFLKVHRSYIVNLSKIKDIQENTLVIAKTVIPISRANKPVLMSRLNFL